MRWRHFKDNRGPTGVSVVHNDVDLILAERILVVHRGGGQRCLPVRGWSRSEEAFEVLIERLFDLLKVLLDRGVAEGRCHVCHGLLDERSHERTLERMHRLLRLLPEALGSGKHVTQTLTKRGVLGAQVPILFAGKCPVSSCRSSSARGVRRPASTGRVLARARGQRRARAGQNAGPGAAQIAPVGAAHGGVPAAGLALSAVGTFRLAYSTGMSCLRVERSPPSPFLRSSPGRPVWRANVGAQDV